MFKDRYQAGELLAQELKNRGYSGPDSIVLAIPRGGVVVGRAVAEKLDVPLDVAVAKKIGSLKQPELAIGAVGPNGKLIVNWDLVTKLGISEGYIREKGEQLEQEVYEREEKFRKDKPPLLITGKTILLVDDGIATGSTVEAVLIAIRDQNPVKIILAAPVAPAEIFEQLGNLVDDLVILDTPRDFRSVGQYYREFPQVKDEEVIKLLELSH